MIHLQGDYEFISILSDISLLITRMEQIPDELYMRYKAKIEASEEYSGHHDYSLKYFLKQLDALMTRQDNELDAQIKEYSIKVLNEFNEKLYPINIAFYTKRSECLFPIRTDTNIEDAKTKLKDCFALITDDVMLPERLNITSQLLIMYINDRSNVADEMNIVNIKLKELIQMRNSDTFNYDII